jgi:2-methylisocitrate lyase-like PEP mutase family enzyme
MPLDRLVAAVALIARVIKVPLTVDMEGGYAPDAPGVGSAVARVIDAGAIGCNIEDGEGTVDALCAKIEQAKKAAARTGVDFWVNARTDVILASWRRPTSASARSSRVPNATATPVLTASSCPASPIRRRSARLPARSAVHSTSWPGPVCPPRQIYKCSASAA